MTMLESGPQIHGAYLVALREAFPEEWPAEEQGAQVGPASEVPAIDGVWQAPGSYGEWAPTPALAPATPKPLNGMTRPDNLSPFLAPGTALVVSLNEDVPWQPGPQTRPSSPANDTTFLSQSELPSAARSALRSESAPSRINVVGKFLVEVCTSAAAERTCLTALEQRAAREGNQSVEPKLAAAQRKIDELTHAAAIVAAKTFITLAHPYTAGPTIEQRFQQTVSAEQAGLAQQADPGRSFMGRNQAYRLGLVGDKVLARLPAAKEREKLNHQTIAASPDVAETRTDIPAIIVEESHATITDLRRLWHPRSWGRRAKYVTRH